MKYTEYEILNKIKKRKPKEELDKEYKNNFFYRNKLHKYLEQSYILNHGLDPLQMDKLILNEEAKNEMYKFETENITPRLQEIRAKRANIISIVAIGIAIASFAVSAITLNNHYKDQGVLFILEENMILLKMKALKIALNIVLGAEMAGIIMCTIGLIITTVRR